MRGYRQTEKAGEGDSDRSRFKLTESDVAAHAPRNADADNEPN